MADALRSGRSSPRECGFNSHRRHHFFNSYAISGGRKNGVLRNHVERFVRSGYSVAATPQPSKLLTRVRLPLPAPILFVVGFPSGQRGQTVNLLSPTSMVRIHLPPPFLSSKRQQSLPFFLFLLPDKHSFFLPISNPRQSKIEYEEKDQPLNQMQLLYKNHRGRSAELAAG